MASSPAGHSLNCSSTSPNLSTLSRDGCLPESGGKCGVQSSQTSPQLLQHLTQPLTTRDVHLRVAARVASSPAAQRFSCSSTSPNLSPLSRRDAYLRVAASVVSNPAGHRLNCSNTSPNLSPVSRDGYLRESGDNGGVLSSRTSPQLLQHLTQPLTTQLNECLPESGGKGGVQSSRTSPQLFQHLTQPLTTQLG